VWWHHSILVTLPMISSTLQGADRHQYRGEQLGPDTYRKQSTQADKVADRPEGWSGSGMLESWMAVG
jgi:hypothetical protein